MPVVSQTDTAGFFVCTMPYNGIPEELTSKMDDCVKKVMAQGHDKSSAIAICETSIMHKEVSDTASPNNLHGPGSLMGVLGLGSGKPKGKKMKRTSPANSLVNKMFPAMKSMLDATEARFKADAETNDLPDSAFLHVEAGGKKDEEGKTEPRSLRHLPYKTASGSVDLPHLRNALSRLGQSDTGATAEGKWLTADLRKELTAKAEKILADSKPKEEKKEKRSAKLVAMFKQFDPEYAQVEAWDVITASQALSQLAQLASREAGEEEPDHVKMIGELMDELTKFIQEEIAEMINGDEEEGAAVTTMEGKRNSAADQEHIQKIHDSAAALGADCMSVVKEASGRLRWVMLSTNSFQDRDKEIASLKALEADTDRMQSSGNYGPLRWWHVGTPNTTTKEAGSGLDIGVCDFSAMHGKVRVESGTFYDERIGAAIEAKAKELSGSIGFFHPIDEPDQAGVYHTIYTFERSILPIDRASNPLVNLAVITKENNMANLKEKFDAFKKLVGEDIAASTVKQAEAVQAAAEQAGIKNKETQADPVAPAIDVESIVAALKEVLPAMVADAVKVQMAALTEKEAGIDAKVAAIESSVNAALAEVKSLKLDAPRAIAAAFKASEEGGTKTAPKIKGLEIDNSHLDASNDADGLGKIVNLIMGNTAKVPQAQ